MAIQGTQVPMYMNIHCFCIFLIPFPPPPPFFWKKKTKQPNIDRQTMEAWKKDSYAWKHDWKVHMHKSMIPKADKKSSKENPTLDRKN